MPLKFTCSACGNVVFTTYPVGATVECKICGNKDVIPSDSEEASLGETAFYHSSPKAVFKHEDNDVTDYAEVEKYCSKCGSKNDNNEKYCSKCGKSLVVLSNGQLIDIIEYQRIRGLLIFWGISFWVILLMSIGAVISLAQSPFALSNRMFSFVLTFGCLVVVGQFIYTNIIFYKRKRGFIFQAIILFLLSGILWFITQFIPYFTYYNYSREDIVSGRLFALCYLGFITIGIIYFNISNRVKKTFIK